MRHLLTPLLVAPLVLLAPAAAPALALAPAPSQAPGSCGGLSPTIVSSTPGATVVGTEDADVIVATAPATITALGGGDVICTSAGGSIDAGAGLDRVVITSFDIEGSIGGGSDRDILQFLPTTRVDVDLEHGGVVMGGQTFDIAGFEDVVAIADRVTVRGDAQSNDLVLSGCIVKGYGGTGDDTLSLGWVNAVHCASRNQQLYGQGGDDRLTGDRLAGNLLVGGGGHDSANGKGGRDRCSAESERRCEGDPR